MVLVQVLLEVLAAQAGAGFRGLGGCVGSARLLHPWRYDMSI